jgi:hypothetical protein
MSDGAYEQGGTWTNASDRNLKEAFTRVDGGELLTKLSALTIESWSYKAEGQSVRHVGPTAQDFFAAFALGSDNKHISTVDEGGVALAAIQQLCREGLKKDATIRRLQAQIEAQRSAGEIQQARIAQLMTQVDAQQADVKAQDARIAELMARVRAIQVSLKTNGQSGSNLRAVKMETRP